MKRGAPRMDTDKAADYKARLLEYIGIEGMTLTSALKQPNMPSVKWVYDELKRDADFEKLYARATEMRADKWFEDLIQLVNDYDEEQVVTETKGIQGDGAVDVVQITKRDAYQSKRLKVDTLKWMLAKMHPKKYGDRIMTEDVTEKPKTLIIRPAKPEL
jgi:hypothetical protein